MVRSLGVLDGQLPPAEAASPEGLGREPSTLLSWESGLVRVGVCHQAIPILCHPGSFWAQGGLSQTWVSAPK